MDHFDRRDGEMYAEEVPLRRIAEAVGTPTYVYSKATILRHFRVFDEAWDPTDHLVCYAVKASSNLAILSLLAKQGAGFDIVSGGELERVLRAGGDPSKIVFSGVGKTAEEITAALDAGILCFNVESEGELLLIDAIGRERKTRAPVSLRINPDVDPESHPYISTGLQESKFGIPWARAPELLHRASRLPGIHLIGLACHIGSQLEAIDPLVDALQRLVGLLDEVATAGIALTHLDIGGGLGIPYGDDRQPPSPAEYARVLREVVGERGLRIILEPGRVIMGNAGTLLMRVLFNKRNDTKRFVIVDAAMNDTIRPALYGAYHAVETVGPPGAGREPADIVGPICESGDFLARDREMPEVEPGDLLMMRSLGAYGFAMASNYNSRRRAAEVLVDGDRFHVIRTRETLEDLWSGESIP